jgi:hypothetical protein
MKLIGTIKNILMEESKRDLSSVIKKLLDGFVDDHKDIICKVEVKHPDDRTKLPHQEYPYNNYRVDFYLIGGYGSDNWPVTQSVRRKLDDLMNEAWDLVHDYTGQKLEMFTKHVKSCDDIIKENKENSIPNMIKTLGISDAIKYFGNYYTIEPYLKEIDKVNFIKEKVNGLTEWIGGGIGLVEIDEEPIHYDEDENEIRQIEYLGKNGVTVDVYDADMNRHTGEFNVNYHNLPSQIIEELVEILLNH